MKWFATCARGLEPFLSKELYLLQAENIQEERGGVSFTGSMDFVYLTNLYLRTAVRILRPIHEGELTSKESLYDLVREVDWQKYLTLQHTFVVDCNIRDSLVTHSLYAAQLMKDAICDQFLEKCGQRPSVDLQNPMLQFNLHIYRNRVVISLDSTGDSLHKRGYRPHLHRAPLNEALACGLIMCTGWDGTTPLVDPMCGSAAIPIEAAWLATNRPPGLTRKQFCFQTWLDYDRQRWHDIRDEARSKVLKSLASPIIGSDIRGDAIRMAEQDARSAGVGSLIKFEKLDIYDCYPPDGYTTGTLLCNPPYGIRIGEMGDLRELYREIEPLFSERFAGWRCWIFTGNLALAKLIRLKVREKYHFMNGTISCQLLGYW